MNVDRFDIIVWPVAPLVAPCVGWAAPVALVPEACPPVAVADATDAPAVREENEGSVTPALEQRVWA